MALEQTKLLPYNFSFVDVHDLLLLTVRLMLVLFSSDFDWSAKPFVFVASTIAVF